MANRIGNKKPQGFLTLKKRVKFLLFKPALTDGWWFDPRSILSFFSIFFCFFSSVFAWGCVLRTQCPSLTSPESVKPFQRLRFFDWPIELVIRALIDIQLGSVRCIVI